MRASPFFKYDITLNLKLDYYQLIINNNQKIKDPMIMATLPPQMPFSQKHKVTKDENGELNSSVKCASSNFFPCVFSYVGVCMLVYCINCVWTLRSVAVLKISLFPVSMDESRFTLCFEMLGSSSTIIDQGC